MKARGDARCSPTVAISSGAARSSRLRSCTGSRAAREADCAATTLVDAIVALGKHVPALSAGRLTVLWYLIPALGAGSWIAFGVAGARSRATRVVAVVALVAVLMAAVAFRQLAGAARLGWGPKVAVLGGVLLCVGAWAPVRRRIDVPDRL